MPVTVEKEPTMTICTYSYVVISIATLYMYNHIKTRVNLTHTLRKMKLCVK